LGSVSIFCPVESWDNPIALYEAWNKREKAEEWRAKLSQVKKIRK